MRRVRANLAALVIAAAFLASLTGVADAQRRHRKGRRARPAAGAPAAPAAPAPTPTAPTPAAASPTAAEPAGKGKAKVFDFTGLDLEGRMRTPQLLYFLDRASEELDRAALERRSFIPEMVRTLDEESL